MPNDRKISRRDYLWQQSVLIAGFSLLDIRKLYAQASFNRRIHRPVAGALFSWGLNNSGQLGVGTTTSTSSPVRIGSDSDWTYVSTGARHTLAVKANGSLWAWGRGDEGQLGLGNTASVSTPVQIGSDDRWLAVSANFHNSMAIRSNGTLWAWGQNEYSSLGTSNSISYSSPVQIGSATDWVAVAQGRTHALMLKSNGTLWAVGDNSSSQLGNGNTTSYSSPIQVGTTAITWKELAPSLNYSLVLAHTGPIYGFGNQGNGRLGDGVSSGTQTAQTATPLITRVEKISSSGLPHALAIRNNGTMWAWGVGTNGSIGNNNTIDISSPVQIGSFTTWKEISTSSTGSSFAITNAGELYSWGQNSDGQLGHSNTTNLSTPTQVGNKSGWLRISSNDSHIVAIRSIK